MSDPRLVSWLEATRAAIDAPAEQRQAALEELAVRREQIAASLAESELSAPISDALAHELEEAEQLLHALLSALSAAVDAQLAELRRARQAAAGYQPTRANLPAFVSRSI